MAGDLTGFGTTAAPASGQGMAAFFAVMMLFVVIGAIIIIALYVYSALALMTIAKKTKTKHAWLAWIPIGNAVLLSMIADMHWWPILLMIPASIFLIISVVLTKLTPASGISTLFMALYYLTLAAFTVFTTMWHWKMFGKIGRPGWWAILTVIITWVGTIFILIKTYPTMILGGILSVAGAALMLIFLGIAAWGKAPVPIRAKKAKRNR